MMSCCLAHILHMSTDSLCSPFSTYCPQVRWICWLHTEHFWTLDTPFGNCCNWRWLPEDYKQLKIRLLRHWFSTVWTNLRIPLQFVFHCIRLLMFSCPGYGWRKTQPERVFILYFFVAATRSGLFLTDHNANFAFSFYLNALWSLWIRTVTRSGCFSRPLTDFGVLSLTYIREYSLWPYAATYGLKSCHCMRDILYRKALKRDKSDATFPVDHFYQFHYR